MRETGNGLTDRREPLGVQRRQQVGGAVDARDLGDAAQPRRQRAGRSPGTLAQPVVGAERGAEAEIVMAIEHRRAAVPAQGQGRRLRVDGRDQERRRAVGGLGPADDAAARTSAGKGAPLARTSST